MQIRKLFFLTFTLGAALAVAAFGSNGLKDLFTTTLNPVEAADGGPAVVTPEAGPSTASMPAAPVLARAGGLMVSARAGGPLTQTVTAIEFVPAPELPTRPPDAGGIFGSRDGNTLTLQSGFVITGTEGNAVFGVGGMAVAGPADGALPAGEPGQAGVIMFSTTTTDAAGEPGQAGEPVGLQTVTVLNQAGPVEGGAVPPLPEGVPSTLAVGPAMPFEPTSQEVVVTEATQIYHDVTPMNFEPTGGTHKVQQTLEPGTLDDLTAPMMVTVWGHKDGEQLVADVIVVQNPFVK